MLKALLKGTILAGFGHLPGGADAYRWLTRQRLGTQSGHVDKLCRVVPGYLRAWRELAGFEPSGSRLWVHEPGWTPFWALAGYLITGRGPVLTNVEARMIDRYTERAVAGVLGLDLPNSGELRNRLVQLRVKGASRVDTLDLLAEVGARLHEGVCPHGLPMGAGSVDLVHSGGVLEHYRPEELTRFLAECYRILAPGGLASHVFDHRDHLHHSDPSWPFLAHLALPRWLYGVWSGHPLGYHNRLAPREVVGLFERVGFVAVAVRRMVLPAGRYGERDEVVAGRPGLGRGWLAGAHRSIDDLDLRTAAAHYLFVKPARGTRVRVT